MIKETNAVYLGSTSDNTFPQGLPPVVVPPALSSAQYGLPIVRGLSTDSDVFNGHSVVTRLLNENNPISLSISVSLLVQPTNPGASNRISSTSAVFWTGVNGSTYSTSSVVSLGEGTSHSAGTGTLDLIYDYNIYYPSILPTEIINTSSWTSDGATFYYDYVRTSYRYTVDNDFDCSVNLYSNAKIELKN